MKLLKAYGIELGIVAIILSLYAVVYGIFNLSIILFNSPIYGMILMLGFLVPTLFGYIYMLIKNDEYETGEK